MFFCLLVNVFLEVYHSTKAAICRKNSWIRQNDGDTSVIDKPNFAKAGHRATKQDHILGA